MLWGVIQASVLDQVWHSWSCGGYKLRGATDELSEDTLELPVDGLNAVDSNEFYFVDLLFDTDGFYDVEDLD